MKKNSVLLAILTLAMIAAFSTASVFAVNGPKTPNFLIHVYNDPDTEFAALQAGDIDLTDWPFSKTWVDTFNLPGSGVALRSYADIGHFEFDINLQRWPTGVTTPRTYDPATDTYKHYYTDGGTPGVIDTPDEQAKEFRTAVAYLTDKDDVITDILKGYAAVQNTPIPEPALSGYVPPLALETDTMGRPLIRTYDPALAASILDGAGFTQGSTPNPDYDAGTPGSAVNMRIDPLTGLDLDPLKFWIRLDDPNRREAGIRLGAQLKKAGVAVDATVSERTVCYNNVMVIYDFNLYTGGWGLSSAAPDSLHFLFHSEQYWGGTASSYFGGVGWSANYNGLADDEYDMWAEGGKFGSQLGDGAPPYLTSEVKDSGFEAVKRYLELMGAIDLYAFLAVKGFDEDWTGLVNYEGMGPDNSWSFMNMEHATDNTIDWGFKSNLEGLNMVTAEWLWDHLAMGLVYESMIGSNPYNLAEYTGMLAESWSDLIFDGVSGLYYADFTLRSGVTFHNGDALRPKDVKFSLEFGKAAGPGVAWIYSDLMNVERVDTQDEDGTLGPRDVRVYYISGVQSYWAVGWAGNTPILNERVWMAANAANGWGYVYGETDFNNFPNRSLVRNYQPELQDSDSDGDVDFKEDGNGPWIFQSMSAATVSASTAFAFSADTGATYFLSQTYVSDFIEWAFWARGDTTKNRVIDIGDGLKIGNDLGISADPDADIAATLGGTDPTWNSVTGTPIPPSPAKTDVFDLNKWALSVKTNLPRQS